LKNTGFLKVVGWEQKESPGVTPGILGATTRCPEKRLTELVKSLKKKIKIALLISLALILLTLGLVGCTSQPAARGWAGVTAINDTLILTTMSGRLYSVNSADNSILGTAVKFEITASGGLSCVPSCNGPSATPIAVYASPATGLEMAIIGGFDGRVYAFPLLDGQLREQYRWKYPPDGDVGGNIVGGLALSGDSVYFASINGTVYALNAAEGYKEWAVELGNKVWSAPAVDGETVYIGCFDKNLYALNAADGSIKWQFAAEGAIGATPILDNGLVYFGGYDRAFYAVDTATGQLVWKFPAEGAAVKPENWFWAQPILHNGIIYAPNLDGKVYALDAATGSLQETFSFETATFSNGAIASSPVVVGDMVVVAITNLSKSVSRVFVIDTPDRTREVASFSEGINAPLFALNGRVYLHTTKDNFFAIDPATGATLKINLNGTTSK